LGYVSPLMCASREIQPIEAARTAHEAPIRVVREPSACHVPFMGSKE
jgi:hypothetical protein